VLSSTVLLTAGDSNQSYDTIRSDNMEFYSQYSVFGVLFTPQSKLFALWN